MDPSILFARSLKTYEDKPYKPNPARAESVTARMVTGFDIMLFHKKCHPASPALDVSLDFDVIAGELFQAGEKWASRDGLLYKAMDELAKLHGYHIRKKKRNIQCTRKGDSSSTQRSYAGGSLAANCPFHVKLKPLCRQSYLANEASTNWSYKDLWSEPVEIVDAACKHGGMCQPSRQNRVIAGQRSGMYVRQVPDHAMFTLCNQYEKTGKIKPSFIKDTLQSVWPTAKNITKHDCFNIRVKVLRLLPVFKKTNGNYEEFKAVANSNELLSGIDNTVSINDDEAYALAQSLWLEVESTSSSCEEAIFSFVITLESLRDFSKGPVTK